MIRMYKLLFMVPAVLVLAACEKVIEVEVDDADERLVIQGNITQEPGPYFVNIHKSVALGETNDFPPVQNASVTISDDLGNVEPLQEAEPGVYATSAMQGQPGRTYFLNVQADGKTYTAKSTMPQPVSLDALMFVEFTGPLGNPRLFTVPVFQDPAGVPNFYRFVLRVNGLTSQSIFLLNDNGRDGETNARPLRSFDPNIQSGDSVWVELYNMDETPWLYYDGLRETGGGLNQTATPFTPATAIEGENVMGYFSAHTVSRKATQVQ